MQILSKMSGKAGELLPSYRTKILPVAPASSPSRPTHPAWVARTPSPAGLEARKNCEDIVRRLRAAAASSADSSGSKWTKTLVGVDGTWFVWKVNAIEKAEEKQQRG